MKIIFYLFTGFVLLVVYVRFLENVSLFYPSRDIAVTPREAGMDYEDVYFVTDDHVRLNGWFVRAKTDPANAPTVLFSHGNAGNIGDRVEKIAHFRDLGLNVFIYDYRGYGRSQGRPTEQGMYRDIRAAYDHLISRKDIRKDRIIAYGASMGGVAAIDLASQKPVAALIADSTFTSAVDMAKRIAPFVPSFLITIKLDNAGKIARVKAPKLFIHSPEDETVPFKLGMKLFEKAPEPKEFLKISGSHNEGYALSQDVFLDGIKSFLQRHGLR